MLEHACYLVIQPVLELVAACQFSLRKICNLPLNRIQASEYFLKSITRKFIKSLLCQISAGRSERSPWSQM
jgi:hypothetical protein